MHELKLIVDLMYQGGLNYMRYSVSDTAEQGDYTSGPRVITAETKAVMKNILDDIRSGKWAAAWVEENATGRKGFESTRKRERSHQIEKVGAQLRGMMPFLRPVTITDEEVNSATVSQNG
jgi:ketol-acid reductoisomerase